MSNLAEMSTLLISVQPEVKHPLQCMATCMQQTGFQLPCAHAVVPQRGENACLKDASSGACEAEALLHANWSDRFGVPAHAGR